MTAGKQDDADFGPRPPGRAGAEIGSRRALLIVVIVGLVAVTALVIVLHARHKPASCAAPASVACDFAGDFTITGYRLTRQTVSGSRAEVNSYYVGPPTSDYLALIAAPGLTLAPPNVPGGTANAPVIGVGSSTDARYAPCTVFVYQVHPPGQRGFASDADSGQIQAGKLAMLRVGIACA